MSIDLTEERINTCEWNRNEIYEDPRDRNDRPGEAVHEVGYDHSSIATEKLVPGFDDIYIKILTTYQARPYLAENTGSRSISKVKLLRAHIVLWLVITREVSGAVLFWSSERLYCEVSIFSF